MLVGSPAGAACGGDDGGGEGAQPAPGVSSFEQGRFDDLPLPTEAEPIGRRSEKEGIVARSFEVPNALPAEFIGQCVRVDAEAPTTRKRLAAALGEAGVNPAAYDLDGNPGVGEKYVLELVTGGWATYYAERGLRQGERRFDTEAEACTTFYDWVSGDPTTRWRRSP